jgi:hypothetical protein
MIRAAGFAVLLAAGAGPAHAQSVEGCTDYRSSLAALVEPWDTASRIFANGAVRLAVTDTLEPAAGAFHLVILSPPYNELGDRQCRLVTLGGGMGFAGLTLDGMTADYDPAVGLVFRLAATRWVQADDSYSDATLTVSLNQSTGAISAQLD